jgi:hypothetical protein
MLSGFQKSRTLGCLTMMFFGSQKAEARRRRAQDATLAELARSYHVGKSTISRLDKVN